MNSVSKGTSLEEAIFALLQSQIEGNRFWAQSQCCEIFKKKSYYSQDRGKNIVFDVAIEITLPDEIKPSLLVLIECKNYSHSVPVDDIEEFWSKVQQVTGANVKGIIATNAALQEGAFNYAKAKGFALLRYFGETNFKWELQRSPSGFGFDLINVDQQHQYQAMSQQNYESEFIDCYCYIGGVFTCTINSLFEKLCDDFVAVLPRSRVLSFINPAIDDLSNQVQFLQRKKIVHEANMMIRKTGYESGHVDLTAVCDHLKLSHDLILTKEKSAIFKSDVLGSITFSPLNIKIFHDAHHSEEQERFTLAHEIGHFALGHDKYLAREFTQPRDTDMSEDSSDAVWLSKDIKRLEWQANYFAACLLLPSEQLRNAFVFLAKSHELQDRGFGYLFVDRQPVNLSVYHLITADLKRHFNASRQAITYRLKELGLLRDHRDTSKTVFTR